jgi:TM2 domain-containing membrane protein YozV
MSGTNQPVRGGSDFWKIFLVSLFLGIFGVHRFITGKTRSGLFQLFTLGFCGLWSFFDLITILLGKFTDKNGNLIHNPNPKASWAIVVTMFAIGLVSGGGGPDGTFDGGGGGGADRHVIKINGNQIATVLFSGDRGVLQVGSRKIKQENEDSIVWDCSVESFSGRAKGSKWEFSLAMDKKTKVYTLNGFNYSVSLHKMSDVESEKFWNTKGLIHD